MADLKSVERAGWRGECFSCRESFLWTKINLMNGAEPYLYCDRFSDVLLRHSDRGSVLALVRQNAGREPSLEQLTRIWEQMELSAPICFCGGQFIASARLKCPNCGEQLSPATQDQLIQTNWITVIDGAAIVGDSYESSYRIRISAVNEK